MAPPSKKIKTHNYFDLTEAGNRFADFFEQTEQMMEQGVPPELEWAKPFLQALMESHSNAVQHTEEVVYNASNLTLGDALELTGIDYWEDYGWFLNEDETEASARKPLSPHSDKTINMIRKSKYTRKFRRESISRTLLEILLCDRLEHLQDTAAHSQIHLASEISMTASVKEDKGGGKITGRADWALGYMSSTNKVEEVLVVIDAKGPSYNPESALAQLLVYLASIQDARSQEKKTNLVVFGLLTDGTNFRFVVLRGNRRAYASEPLMWAFRKDTIVAFLDRILMDAIESSPHTTPTKVANTRIKKFDASLRESYNFSGEDSSSKGGEGDDSDKEAWDVVTIQGAPLLLRSKVKD